MLENLPNLAFIPVDKVVLHERHDNQRTPALKARMRLSGVFRNPPIVTPLEDGSNRFMVLDGANRMTALKQLEIPHVLAQIVESDHQGLILQAWNHVVWDLSSRDFLSAIRMVSGVRAISKEEEKLPDFWEKYGLVKIHLSVGGVFNFCASSQDLKKRVMLMNAVVDSYKDRAYLDRTNEYSVDRLVDIYPTLTGLVSFPSFELPEIMYLASEGSLLPTGITRFTISPRALHVNYPFEELYSSKPIEEKNQVLQRWIQDRIASKGVRYYPEATILYDE
jgi:L-serine kinase (ATP) / ParB family transcriptional regulator, heme-responsive regulator